MNEARQEKDFPCDWDLALLGKQCRTYSGGTPSRTRREYFGGGIPWIKSGELNQTWIYSTEETLSESGARSSSAKYVEPNTLIYALYGATAGVVGVAKIKALINQAVLAIVPGDRISSDYLFRYLEHNKGRILARYVQGGQPNLSAEIVKNLKIPVPSLPEQKKIATILGTWDEAIASTGKLIEAKQKLKKGLMQQLLTGKKRFDGFKGQHWKHVLLKNVVDCKSSNVDKKSHGDETRVRLCNYLDVYNNSYIFDSMSFMEATASRAEIAKFCLHHHDVVITKDSETPDDIANAAVVCEELTNVVCGYHLAILRPHKKVLSGEFLSQMLMLPVVRHQFTRGRNLATRFGL
jgi:type I restriction enzyme S subunit